MLSPLHEAENGKRPHWAQVPQHMTDKPVQFLKTEKTEIFHLLLGPKKEVVADHFRRSHPGSQRPKRKQKNSDRQRDDQFLIGLSPRREHQKTEKAG